jgi:hypothetical protein
VSPETWQLLKNDKPLLLTANQCSNLMQKNQAWLGYFWLFEVVCCLLSETSGLSVLDHHTAVLLASLV